MTHSRALLFFIGLFCYVLGVQASTALSHLDSDFDGLSDEIERILGTDPQLMDTDGDGLSDGVEVGNEPATPIDSDHDRMIDALDIDDDNDGIPTVVESKQDSDGDGVKGYLDLDTDGDGISDSLEAGISGLDTDNDGLDDAFDVDQNGGEDDNGDGIDGHRLMPDSDGDGTPDISDAADNDGDGGDLDEDGLSNHIEVQLGSDPTVADSDGDGVPDALEVGDALESIDTDGDGQPDILDADDDNDGVLTRQEVPNRLIAPYLTDTDADGVSNYLDADDDGDGVASRDEDTNRNGQLFDDDDDLDGIANYLDFNDGDGPNADRDNDGLPDHLELALGSNPAGTDTDYDGISDELEIGLYESTPVDTDGDGIFDFLDKDDDGDGILTVVEGEGDRDGDGRVDYLDVDSGVYFYCVDDGRIVEGVRDFGVYPAKYVDIESGVTSGDFRWQATQPGTYTLKFTLPEGMRIVGQPDNEGYAVAGVDTGVLSLGRGEDIAKKGFLSEFNRDNLPDWYQQFVIQDPAMSVINLNIPLQGGVCSDTQLSVSDKPPD
uniref:Internalin n=1 Tax=uncultured Thiotrichaceae bacterium TaxID=298394 RepID=A0A6S6TWU6_9GAMM|nr:MAG: Unknown protein [uncultured Thiotrichaceae bacterium]